MYAAKHKNSSKLGNIDTDALISAVKALATASQAEVSTAAATPAVSFAAPPAPAAPIAPVVSAAEAAEVHLRSILGRAKKGKKDD
jgi:hypothetical protein